MKGFSLLNVPRKKIKIQLKNTKFFHKHCDMFREAYLGEKWVEVVRNVSLVSYFLLRIHNGKQRPAGKWPLRQSSVPQCNSVYNISWLLLVSIHGVYRFIMSTFDIKNSYLLFNMPSDKPLLDSCKVYSNVAFRTGNVCTWSGESFSLWIWVWAFYSNRKFDIEKLVVLLNGWDLEVVSIWKRCNR